MNMLINKGKQHVRIICLVLLSFLCVPSMLPTHWSPRLHIGTARRFLIRVYVQNRYRVLEPVGEATFYHFGWRCIFYCVIWTGRGRIEHRFSISSRSPQTSDTVLLPTLTQFILGNYASDKFTAEFILHNIAYIKIIWLERDVWNDKIISVYEYTFVLFSILHLFI